MRSGFEEKIAAVVKEGQDLSGNLSGVFEGIKGLSRTQRRKLVEESAIKRDPNALQSLKELWKNTRALVNFLERNGVLPGDREGR